MVTGAEFRSVHRGMLKSRVVRIWDGPGRVAEGGRTFGACGGGHVNVDYSFTARPRVLAKYKIPK